MILKYQWYAILRVIYYLFFIPVPLLNSHQRVELKINNKSIVKGTRTKISGNKETNCAYSPKFCLPGRVLNLKK